MLPQFPTPSASPVAPPTDLTPERGSIQRWRRFGLGMLVCGGVAIELVLLLPGVTTDEPAVVHVAAFGLLALAGLLAARRGASFLGITRVVIATAVVLITALVSVVDGVEMLPLFYVWPMLAAAYLLTRLEVVAAAITAGLGCATGLVLRDGLSDVPWVDFGIVIGVGFAVVASVRMLAENLGMTIDSLRHTSSTDPLTGLLNRRGFHRRLARHYDRAVMDDRPITALLIDIDHFKQINDEFGHPVGDRALIRFTEMLGASCRASDLVARVGGEEFAVVMPGATIEQAIARAEQFCSILRADRAVDGIRMTASVGIAARARVDGGWEAMLEAADAAVYEAKRTGRDRVVTSEPVGV